MSGYWATVGDTAHMLSLVNVLLFAFAVRFHRETVFDPLWREQGFCVMNPDTEFWTSHDLCLYADVALAAVQGVVFFLLRNQPGMETATTMQGASQILGIIGHGIGHGAIARSVRRGDHLGMDLNQSSWEAGQFDGSSFVDFMIQSGPYLIFWMLLLRATLPGPSWPSIAVVAVICQTLQQFFPRNFGFTYVQSVLFMLYSWTEWIMKPKEEKGFEYALYPCIVSIPLGMIGWLESTQCSKFVIRLGGHLIYDAYIPLATLLFYMICWLRASVDKNNNINASGSTSTKTKVS